MGFAMTGGFITGVVIANPPDSVLTQTSLVSLLIESEIENSLGKKPVKIIPVAYNEAFENLKGDIVSADKQPVENYFIVHMNEDSQLKGSAIEATQEDVLDLSEKGIYVAKEVNGEVEILDVRY
jgi:hypothetical protein